MKATVIGAGLAGVEAARQLSVRGIEVTLFEMRPKKS
ncbi:MAG: NAD(P)-binding protein, partial [Acutalibacteraceae bacterium]